MEQWHWLMMEVLGLGWAGYDLYSPRRYKRREQRAAEAAAKQAHAAPPGTRGMRNGKSD